MTRLKEKYFTEIRPAIRNKFGLANIMSAPQVKKIVVNAGVGKTLKDPKLLDAVIGDLKQITGQQPVKMLARKSVSGFKIRQNQVVGVSVTLRGKRMYDFLEKLVNIALPRVRDFRGSSPKSFDGSGNYHLGIREQTVFPEISDEGIEHSFGFEISIVTTAGSDEKGRELLKSIGFRFSEDLI